VLDVENLRVSGIYKLTCIPTNQIYIGSSINIISRWYQLITSLSNSSRNVQAALYYYGYSNFKFEILELVKPEQLEIREQYWILTLKSSEPRIGFNRSIGVRRAMSPNVAVIPNAAIIRFGEILQSEVTRLTQTT
jgi:group I intron endonuclease